MTILLRLLFFQIYQRVLLVTVGLLGIFTFLELMGQVAQVGRNGYELLDSFLYVLLRMPSIFYETFPIATLLGSLWAFALMTFNSESVIYRTCGFSPFKFALSMFFVGLPAVLLMFFISEAVIPRSEPLASQVRNFDSYKNTGKLSRSGFWVRDVVPLSAQGTRARFLNFGELSVEGAVSSVEVYEFDADLSLRRHISAKSANVELEPSSDDALVQTRWSLHDARVTRLGSDGRFFVHFEEDLRIDSALEFSTLLTLLMRPEQMSAIALSRYGAYLSRNGQSREKYDNELWRKAFYPTAIWVMLFFGCIVSFVNPRRTSATAWGLLGTSLGILFYFVYNIFGSLFLISPEYAYLRGLLPFLIGVGFASGGLTLAARRAF